MTAKWSYRLEKAKNLNKISNFTAKARRVQMVVKQVVAAAAINSPPTSPTERLLQRT